MFHHVLLEEGQESSVGGADRCDRDQVQRQQGMGV